MNLASIPNRPALAAALAALGLALSGCVTDGAYSYGPPRAYANVEYYGYYDGYYGPFTSGYWGPGSVFFFLDQSTGRYRRDDGRHFRHDAGPGFNPIQGHAPPYGRPGRGQPHGQPQGPGGQPSGPHPPRS